MVPPLSGGYVGLSTHHAEASRARSHLDEIVGIVSAFTVVVVCGFLLSFRSNRRALYTLVRYSGAAAIRLHSNSQRQLASALNAALPSRPRSIGGGSVIPIFDNDSSSGEQAAYDDAENEMPEGSLDQRRELMTTSGEAAVTMVLQAGNVGRSRSDRDRELAALEAELAELRQVHSLAYAPDVPPAYE